MIPDSLKLPVAATGTRPNVSQHFVTESQWFPGAKSSFSFIYSILYNPLTFPMQDSNVHVWVTVECIQLLQQTPRSLLVHRITHLGPVYRHSNHGPLSL